MEWLAPIALALAVSWASWRLGIASLATIAAGAAALMCGFAAFRLGSAGPQRAIPSFEPVAFEPVELDELLLEERDAILELDDRLEAPPADSRVVRLFERQEPTPGELVDRIVDFLAEGRRQERPATAVAEAGRHADASAALHDALANIRASLR